MSLPSTSHSNRRTQLADAGISDASSDSVAEAVAHAAEDAARRERIGVGAENSDVAEVDLGDGSPAAQVKADGTFTDAGGQPTPDDEDNQHTKDRGIYAEYGTHTGGVQLASTTIPMDSIGIIRANPTNWANLRRLADGTLELGSGQLITAATLVSSLDQYRERIAVLSVITKFGLNPTHAEVSHEQNVVFH